MLDVRYVGSKPEKVARFGDRMVRWAGPSDVQAVPSSARAMIEAHPDVWSVVGVSEVPDPLPVAETEPDDSAEVTAEPLPLVDLNGMDKAALQAYCQRELGQSVDKSWSAPRLRKYVLDVMGQRNCGAG